MTHTSRTLLLGTALTLPFAGVATAQSLGELTEQDIQAKSNECRILIETARNNEDTVLVPAADLMAAIDGDRAEECATLTRDIEATEPTMDANSVPGTAETAEIDETEETEKVTQELDLSEDATIEGSARVSVPEPDVDVQVPAANVTVLKQLPQVTVNESPLDIQIAQQQPNVEVEIPEIIVRVDIPAPDVYILSSDPNVEISTADPRVQVEQGEPTVSVTQADPELNVDLGVDPDAQAVDTTSADATVAQSQSGDQNVSGNTEVARSEPQVDIQQAEGQPEVAVNAADPSVSYEKTEPKITVVMASQPSIDVQQGSEPNVIIETPEEREQRLSGDADNMSDTAAGSQSLVTDEASAAENTAANTDGYTMTVGDLDDLDVITADGENLGRPAGFINRDGQPMLVLRSGGFLGLGAKEVPVPLNRVSVRDDALVVETMTEEEVENASDFDFGSAERLEDDHAIQIMQH